jgi:hypothetical protein
MIETPTRRGFLTGLVAFVAAAPAIVRVSSIMPVKAIDWTIGVDHGVPYMFGEMHRMREVIDRVCGIPAHIMMTDETYDKVLQLNHPRYMLPTHWVHIDRVAQSIFNAPALKDEAGLVKLLKEAGEVMDMGHVIPSRVANSLFKEAGLLRNAIQTSSDADGRRNEGGRPDDDA